MTMKKIIIAALMAGIMPKMAGAQDIKIIGFLYIGVGFAKFVL